jgi:hypothetical protein
MDDIATRRAAARRTAIIIAVVAIAVYGAFLLSGWMGAL